MRKYFGTDGIRRIANTELTPELVYKVAKAGAYVLSKNCDHAPTILIGRDTRISGTLIESAMTAGFLSYGANVKLLGVIPTPGVAYLTKKLKVDASVVISASHNTYEFNGIKYFSNKGMKIPDEIEEQIEVIPFLEFDLRKNVETILSKIVLNEKNKEQILDINWKNTKVQKFTNIESTIKEKLKNEKEAIILVSGSKKYIKIVNEMIERYFNKYRNNKKYITVINCFEVEEFDDDIRDILYEHEYIINTSGINKIEDVFEIYKEKQAN